MSTFTNSAEGLKQLVGGRPVRSLGALVAATAVLFVLLTLSPTTSVARPSANQTTTTATTQELPIAKAVILGVVEGVTEFLPVSSTGHLLVAERLLDIGTSSDDAKNAADAYTVIIQLGAIAAVLLISWRRVLDVLNGLVGRSETGRRLLLALVCGFVPAAIVGLLFNDAIDRHLLRPVPVAIAWIVGGIAIAALSGRYRQAIRSGRGLDAITPRQAVIIGVAQSAALWPGVSRSLVTILAAVLLGFSLTAAVEFSFLLGLCTLGAASGYSLLKDGSFVFDRFGTASPLIGVVVAAVAAALSVKWMVGYLARHDLRVFAGYRVLVGIATLGLVAGNVI